jgi:hypothetical protein
MHSSVDSGSPGLINGAENDRNGSARLEDLPPRRARVFLPSGTTGTPRSRWHMVEARPPCQRGVPRLPYPRITFAPNTLDIVPYRDPLHICNTRLAVNERPREACCLGESRRTPRCSSTASSPTHYRKPSNSFPPAKRNEAIVQAWDWDEPEQVGALRVENACSSLAA